MKYKILSVLIFTLNTSLFAQSKFPEKYSPNKFNNGQSIFDIVNVPEEKIDVGLWSLIIAKEFDNSIDVNYYLNKLDEMSKEIKRMLAGRNKDMDKFLATKTFLYETGEWNNYNIFSYDLADPLGNILEHQLLPNYIDTKKGNCVSMPTLFLVLMKRVDPAIQFLGVKAPLHLFCRLKDRQTGDVWNIEATNGGNPARNQWYIDKMQISQKALDNKLYLKDLTNKEFIAELIGTLVAKERRKGNLEKAIKYTDLVLKLNPNSDMGLVNKGAISAEIAYNKSQNETLSEEENKYYKEETEKNIEKAKELGWKPESEKEREKYIESVNTERSKTEDK